MAYCCTRLPLTSPFLSKLFSASRLHPPSSAKLYPSFSPSSLSRFFPAACATASLSSSSFQTLSPEAGSARSPAIARNVIEVLEERGLIESITHDDIRSACSTPSSAPVKVYCGFDPTAESLHLGNLLGLIVLSWFQRCGHIPVALLGGATARVGDPSGKSAERPSLDEETIERNLKGVQSNIEQVLKVRVKENDVSESFKARVMDMEENVNVSDANDARVRNAVEGLHASVANALESNGGVTMHPALVLNNYDWWSNFSLLQFLRDVGKYARVGTMMAKESVKKRLNSEEGMSFTEFTYQLLQGYDFVHLFRSEGVSIQIGGSDQWGNIIAGTDLIRKVLLQERAYGLTFPLLLKSDGTKFGKSEGGAIWLAQSMLSPYKFYQHLFATPDADVIVFLKRLTFLSLDEICELEGAMSKPGYVANSAQKKLAEEVTRFVHGEEGLEEALRATEALAPGGTTRLDWRSMETIAADLPSFSTSLSSVQGSPLVDLCVSSGLLASKGAVRRLIKQGGLYLNNEKVEDEGKIVEQEDIVDMRMLLLSAGKKNKMVVRLQ
eukprot:c43565_g1_i1 orf=354-2015(-)